MTKTNKCDADVCFGGSGTRQPRVRCELCPKSVHAKCADIPSTLVKPLRESPGICWLCPKCRILDNRKHSTTNPTLDLILQRTTSSLTLIGSLIDSMKLFCKTTTPTCPRPCCSAPSRSTDAPALEHSVGEVSNEQLDFTTLFESILGEKRPRTSSVSGTSLSQPDKITKIDVPISLPPRTTTTDHPVSDADGRPTAELELAVADAIGNLLSNSASTTSTAVEHGATQPAEHAAVPTTTSTAVELGASRPAEHAAVPAAIPAAPMLRSIAAELAAPVPAHNASAKTVPAPTTHANSIAAQQAAAQAAKTASAHALKQATALAVQQIVQKLTTAAEVRAAAQAVESAATDAASTVPQSNIVEPMDTSRTSAEPVRIPTTANLAVAPLPTAKPTDLQTPHNPQQHNWYYVTRFLPHETPENLINYVTDKTQCDPSKILCTKLVRQGLNGKRQLTFLSFKISVPLALEKTITEESFWPAGVTIKPFLEDRPRPTTNSRSRPRLRPDSTTRLASIGRSTTPQPQKSKTSRSPSFNRCNSCPLFPDQWPQYHLNFYRHSIITNHTLTFSCSHQC